MPSRKFRYQNLKHIITFLFSAPRMFCFLYGSLVPDNSSSLKLKDGGRFGRYRITDKTPLSMIAYPPTVIGLKIHSFVQRARLRVNNKQKMRLL